MLLLTVRSKAADFAVISMTADAQRRGEDMESFCGNPTPIPSTSSSKSNSLDRKPLNRTLVIGMLKCGSPQWMESAGGEGCGEHKLDVFLVLIFTITFLGKRSQGGHGWTRKDRDMSMIGMHVVKLPKNSKTVVLN